MLEILQEKKIAQTNNETKPMLQGRLSGLERIKTLWINDLNHIVSKGFSDK